MSLAILSIFIILFFMWYWWEFAWCAVGPSLLHVHQFKHKEQMHIYCMISFSQLSTCASAGLQLKLSAQFSCSPTTVPLTCYLKMKVQENNILLSSRSTEHPVCDLKRQMSKAREANYGTKSSSLNLNFLWVIYPNVCNPVFLFCFYFCLYFDKAVHTIQLFSNTWHTYILTYKDLPACPCFLALHLCSRMLYFKKSGSWASKMSLLLSFHGLVTVGFRPISFP